jgi:hypothetical protein
MTSVWMKGTAGAALEMQVRIVNTDGTASGSITSFAATGGWQRESATANVTPGKVGDVVQILALRRVAAGPDTFYVDGAQAGPGTIATALRLTTPGAGRERVVPLATIGSGLDVHLGRGLNRITMSTPAGHVTLSDITLTKAPGPTANLCANSGFESSVRGWVGFSGREKLSRVTTEHALGSAALRVSIPDADLQGTVYNTTKGQAIPGGTPVTTSLWMKGTAGAALEMQVRIVNTDGTSSGSITSFAASGGWQRKSATANVTPGKTGDVVQILALRRVASGPDTFYVDGAQAGPGNAPG